MKVYLGPYNHWFQPYRWAKKLMRWWYGFDKSARLNLEQYEKVDEYARNKFKWLRAIEDWVDARYKRKVKIRVDPYDTWSMDNTLAPIVLLMLKQLKTTKHGSAMVDDDDVPDELKSTSAAPLTEAQVATGHTDNNVHKRWDWVMGEMIWAFEQIVDDEAESQFHSDADPSAPSDDPSISFSESVRRRAFDVEAYKVWQARKTRGLTLFGKYFEGLWD
jgi:hypothetical protein